MDNSPLVLLTILAQLNHSNHFLTNPTPVATEKNPPFPLHENPLHHPIWKPPTTADSNRVRLPADMKSLRERVSSRIRLSGVRKRFERENRQCEVRALKQPSALLRGFVTALCAMGDDAVAGRPRNVSTRGAVSGEELLPLSARGGFWGSCSRERRLPPACLSP